MIKMLINEEEVVSNKEFTINEEMLSTSSTILNNCYPKTWEDTKDYVNNFYYPLDYSKFKLIEGDFLHGNTQFSELNVSGVLPSFETNVEKEFKSIEIDGKSYQATRDGKNLFNVNNGVVVSQYCSVDDDGWITATYDNSSGTSTIYLNYFTGKSSQLKTSTDYVIFTEIKSITGTGALYVTSPQDTSQVKNTTYYDFKNLSTGEIKRNIVTTKDSFDSTAYMLRSFISFPANTSGSITFRISVLEDTSTTIDNFKYEKYGVSPSPDYPSEVECIKGKNLFDGVFELGIINGDTGENRANDNYIRNKNYIPVKELTHYKFSSPNYTGASVFVYEYKEDFSYNLILNKTIQLSSYLTTNKGTKYIRFRPSIASTDINIKFQLEEGMTATDYLPYNTIQVKNTGINIFNSENWYETLHNVNSASMVKQIVDGNEYYKFWPNAIWNIPYMRGKFKENTQYVISAKARKFDNITQVSTGFAFIYTDGTSTYVNVRNTFEEYDYYLTSAPGKTIDYIRLGYNYNDYVLMREIQLQERILPLDTTYVPYQEKVLNINLQDNELCSLPNNIKDELVIENGRAKIIKRVNKVILNGTENWQNWNFTSDTYIGFVLDNYINYNNSTGYDIRGISNYFEVTVGGNNYLENLGLRQSGDTIKKIYICMLKSRVSGIATLKEWLSTHNTIVYYELATPTEIDLGEVDTLSTFKGINNVFLNANMETNMNLVYYYKNYDLKFCGLVKNSGDISLNPRYPKYCSLQILDFKTLLSEGETLDFVINNKTIIQAIRMVISAISDYGFVEGNINIFNEDEEIGAYSTLNKTAYDVFQYLADISGSRWTTRLVDENTIAIDFYDTTLMPKGKNLEYNSNYWEDNKVVDLTFNFGTRDYRNKQIMLSDEVYADIDYTEEVITDGYATTFNLSSNIGTIYSISINDQEATFTTEINKKIGVIADFYYEVGKSKIESDDLLTSGKVIKVTYVPLVKGRQIVYNNDEVARVTNQIGRKGTISRYESRNDVLSSSELNSIGQTYIKYKGSAEIILNLKVEDNDIYNVGDVVYFDAPIQNLAQDYMVKRKTIDIINVNDYQKIFYTYELTSSFNSERDINYFDNQRNKSTGNISEGDTIDRNIDIEDTANIIFYGLEINEIQVEGNNTLNSVLNSPFVN